MLEEYNLSNSTSTVKFRPLVGYVGLRYNDEDEVCVSYDTARGEYDKLLLAGYVEDNNFKITLRKANSMYIFRDGDISFYKMSTKFKDWELIFNNTNLFISELRQEYNKLIVQGYKKV